MGRGGGDRPAVRSRRCGCWRRRAEEPVGALTASLSGDRGWVDYLAVSASHRGRGVGAALLRHSFSVLARPGVERVLVNVDAENPTGATALYERVGMRIVKRWDLWERSFVASLRRQHAPEERSSAS